MLDNEEDRVMRPAIQQHAQSAPRGSDSAFRRMIEKLPAAAYTCDAEGLITYFNQRAVDFWGRKPKLNDPVDRY
jgi:PAS domain-containing protein